MKILRVLLFAFITTNVVVTSLYGDVDDVLCKVASEKIAIGEFSSAFDFITRIINASKRRILLKAIGGALVDASPEEREIKTTAIVNNVIEKARGEVRKNFLGTIADAVMTEKTAEAPNLSFEERFVIASGILNRGQLSFKDVFQKYRDKLDDTKLRNLLTDPDFASKWGYPLDGSEISNMLGLLRPLAPEPPVLQAQSSQAPVLVEGTAEVSRPTGRFRRNTRPTIAINAEVLPQLFTSIVGKLSTSARRTLLHWISEPMDDQNCMEEVSTTENSVGVPSTIEISCVSPKIKVTRQQVTNLPFPYNFFLGNLLVLGEFAFSDNASFITVIPNKSAFDAWQSRNQSSSSTNSKILNTLRKDPPILTLAGDEALIRGSSEPVLTSNVIQNSDSMLFSLVPETMAEVQGSSRKTVFHTVAAPFQEYGWPSISSEVSPENRFPGLPSEQKAVIIPEVLLGDAQSFILDWICIKLVKEFPFGELMGKYVGYSHYKKNVSNLVGYDKENLKFVAPSGVYNDPVKGNDFSIIASLFCSWKPKESAALVTCLTTDNDNFKGNITETNKATLVRNNFVGNVEKWDNLSSAPVDHLRKFVSSLPESERMGFGFALSYSLNRKILDLLIFKISHPKALERKTVRCPKLIVPTEQSNMRNGNDSVVSPREASFDEPISKEKPKRDKLSGAVDNAVLTDIVGLSIGIFGLGLILWGHNLGLVLASLSCALCSPQSALVMMLLLIKCMFL